MRYQRKGNQLSENESSSGSGKLIKSLLGGSFLAKDSSVRFLPFLLLLTFFGLIYIANIYYAEENIRKIDDLNRELKELRYEYISTHNKLMHISKQSELAKRLEKMGLFESTTPPFKIRAEENKIK